MEKILRSGSKNLIALALAVMSASHAHANLGDSYGYGAATAALGGAGVASQFDAYSVYANPANLPGSTQPSKRLSFSWGLKYMDPDFTAISNVVVENQYVSDKFRTSDVDVNYKPTFGQEIGLSYQLTKDVTFGLALFVPIQQLAYIDSGESFVPEYFRYRADTQRPEISLGLGFEVLPTLSFGAGFRVGFSVESSASVFLQTATGKPSTMRFTSTMKPKGAPYFGLLFATPKNAADRFSLFTAGLVFRLSLASANTIALASGARILGSAPGLDFNLSASSTLYYDPKTIELGFSFREFDIARTILQLEYQFWGAFEAPALLIVQPQITSCDTNCGVIISQGNNPAFTYRNTWVARIGQEFATRFGTYRLGYAYHPSIIQGLPTEAGNYLDPDKSSYNAGVGFRFERFLGFNAPYNVDFNLSYQHLHNAHVDKSPGNEAGEPTDLKIGAPGYDIGGKILGGGVTLSLAF